MTALQQASNINRQWTLKTRPVGAPNLEHFNFIETDKPSPKQGEILLRTVFLSLDPYMRGRMSDAKSYAEPVAIDETMVGGTVCRVEESNNPDYTVGEWVVPYRVLISRHHQRWHNLAIPKMKRPTRLRCNLDDSILLPDRLFRRP